MELETELIETDVSASQTRTRRVQRWRKRSTTMCNKNTGSMITQQKKINNTLWYQGNTKMQMLNEGSKNCH